MDEERFKQARNERIRLLNKGKPAPTRKPHGEAARNQVIASYKRSAKKKESPFELTMEQCEWLFQSNCFYCNRIPSQVSAAKTFFGDYIYTGIDRTNNAKGYHMNNVVPCCNECNKAKGALDIEEFFKHVERIKQ